ncbi:4453_t:CDS:2, partial [Ambispora leptoticha]
TFPGEGCKEAQIFFLFSAKFWPAAYFISYGTITEPKSFLYFGTTRI